MIMNHDALCTSKQLQSHCSNVTSTKYYCEWLPWFMRAWIHVCMFLFVRLTVYAAACVCVCVCVCDTSEETLNFSGRGHGNWFPIRANEATEISWRRIGTPILVPASFFLIWHRAKPRTRHDMDFMNYFICIVAAIWNLFLFYDFQVFDVMDDSGIWCT